VTAALTFAAVFGAGILAGYEIYDRLLRGSTAALVILLLGFAAVGAYGGWLLGVVVFAAVRSQSEGDA
jgi:hypothetical protein